MTVSVPEDGVIYLPRSLKLKALFVAGGAIVASVSAYTWILSDVQGIKYSLSESRARGDDIRARVKVLEEGSKNVIRLEEQMKALSRQADDTNTMVRELLQEARKK